MPLFSVVIPSFNRLALLKQTLSSLSAQEHPDHEVIVVDDGSTDGTQEELARFGDGLTVIRQDNRGPAAARNAAIACARGCYLAFLDSDDLWFPWTEGVYRDIIRRHGSPAFVAGRPFRFASTDELAAAERQPTAEIVFPDYLASSDDWRWFGSSSFVMKTGAVRRVGGFSDIWVGEDADLALKFGTEPLFVQVLAPCTFGYRDHQSLKADTTRAIHGATKWIETERGGLYPGGWRRAAERRRIMTRAIRPLTLQCLLTGNARTAWRLFWETLGWNLRQLRIRYTFGFLTRAALQYISRRPAK